ncbi:MAG: hypothetical protein JXX14_05960, partial [Deltaproteobacteria bacterium]|nr:hypothetical protein [Deltaproteobacteria bacterium]
CVYTNVADGTVCATDTDLTDCLGANTCLAGVCTATPLSAGTSCGAGADTDTDNCVVGFQCDGLGDNCVEVHEAAGADCAINEVAYPPMCWDGFCGTVTSSSWYPTFDATSPDGACYEIMKSAPDNDVCAGAAASAAGDLGSFANTEEVAVSVTGSTVCAGSTSQSGAMNCIIPTGMAMGIGAKDLVYSFGYTTTDATQQQLYGFVVTVESDFRAVLYTETDSCTDGTVNGHPCQWQPELDNGGVPVPWEYAANNQGRDWDGVNQRCDSSGSSGYQWCLRGSGSWSYPEDVTDCKFNNDGTYACDSSATYTAQTFIYPISDEAASNHRVYIHVDGATAADEGNFTLKVARVAWQNGACERVNDAPRVYDVTDVSSTRIYRGNLTGVANSDHTDFSSDCGGYDCAATWFGTTSAHTAGTANAFWPNAAFFKVQPTSNTTYCVTTDHTGVTGGIDPVLEVVELTTLPFNNPKNLCQGYTSPISGVPAAEGPDGVGFLGESGKVYLVKLSERDENTAPCTANCNYRMVVSEDICGEYCAPTTTNVGWSFYSNGTSSFTHSFLNETSITLRAKGENNGTNWPAMTVKIGGTTIMNVTVSNTDWGLYQATFPAYTGDQTVSVSFANDSWGGGGPGGDSNLFVESVTLGCDDQVDLLIQENTVGFCNVDGAVYNDQSGYTGDGFANTDNALGNGIEWSVASPAGQNTVATLTFRYANGGAANRPANLIVNGTSQGSVSFPVTGGWTNWTTVQTSAVLTEEINSILLEATAADGLGNVDWLTVSGPGLTTGDCALAVTCETTILEAEAMNHTVGSALGVGWALWISGSIYDDATFTANTSMTVRAAGTLHGSGELPNMVVKVDGATVMDVDVVSTTYSDYSIQFASTFGNKEVRVNFTNDRDDSDGDINLFVDNITLGCDGDGSAPAISVDTDTSDDCVPAGCEGATTLSELDFTGWYTGCVYVPYDATYHMSTWGWSYGDLELIKINDIAVNPGDVWAPSEMPASCNGGWYVYINLNSFDSHVEIKP